ncbi:MAG: AraC family transcriptional regulator [Xanthomonas sp.]|uniref:helix-turn-helix domain-containing protein n=1 Tax=Pseudoxanthomonas mexicana TaxID=128785 RepID=UPI00078335C9|nr:AraC family transcriptional regulator [Pseudoxanthomonas mexicana]MBA3930206.1 AraC family transcriptional regulator [Xanthomonas sp.]
MQDGQMVATGIAVAVATMSLLLLLWQRPKRDAEVLFAVVSGSMALSLMSPWMVDAPAWMRWAVAIGGSATCNGYWLVSRALFRGEGGVRRMHVMVAAGVALLIAAYRGATLAAHGGVSPWSSGLDSVLTLASSTLLVLSFLEALRGWSSSLPQSERRLRVAFMVMFAGCVLSATLVGAVPAVAGSRAGVVAACALAMVLFTHVALAHRRRRPLPSPAAAASTTRAVGVLTGEEARLAAALRHQLDVRQVYREPELKVVDLAQRLGTVEHRLSRLITQGLGEKNFNQMVNRYRIAYACRRLAEPEAADSILDISGDAGFASLGPFNRAFKAAMDCTPSAYRAACRAQAGADDGTQAALPSAQR